MISKYLNSNYRLDNVDMKSYWAVRKYSIINKSDESHINWFKLNEELQKIFAITKDQARLHIDEWFSSQGMTKLQKD